MTDVVVRFFNSQRVLDPFVERRFTPEVEEEDYRFKVTDVGNLDIIKDFDCCGTPVSRTVASFADGRWAEVEYE